jgi:hypothetical protein
MTMITIITQPCMVCSRTSSITAPAEAVEQWRAGALIQNALPMLTADEREMLITGTHPLCFDELFDEEG